MAEQIYFEDIAVGDEIPELSKDPSTQQLVHWAAGSGDFYQIHYDTRFAQETGLEDIIVHGALKHAWLGELLHRFAAPSGQVRRVACSYRGMDVPGQSYRLKGTVTKKSEADHTVEVSIWGENEDGSKTTPGTGVVVLPSRG